MTADSSTTLALTALTTNFDEGGRNILARFSSIVSENEDSSGDESNGLDSSNRAQITGNADILARFATITDHDGEPASTRNSDLEPGFDVFARFSTIIQDEAEDPADSVDSKPVNPENQRGSGLSVCHSGVVVEDRQSIQGPSHILSRFAGIVDMDEDESDEINDLDSPSALDTATFNENPTSSDLLSRFSGIIDAEDDDQALDLGLYPEISMRPPPIPAHTHQSDVPMSSPP